MPSVFPRAPKLLKGALVAYASQYLGRVPNVIVFQYNPAELSRTLSDRASPPEPSKVGAAKEDAQRPLGPPVETINLTVELDAADQLEEPLLHRSTVELGLHPALTALEILMYPDEQALQWYRVLVKKNVKGISPPDKPLVLFVWGASRVAPVRLTDFSVTEDAFDQRLNPIRAKVTLGMRVLTSMEVKESSLGYNAYLALEARKRTLAAINLANNAADQVSGLLPF